MSYYIELDYTFDLLVMPDNTELIFREFKSARAGLTKERPRGLADEGSFVERYR